MAVAIRSVTRNIYTEMAASEGASTFDRALYRKAARMALGSHDGERGGIGRAMGSTINLPPQVQDEDDFSDALDGITTNSLHRFSASGQLPRYEDGSVAEWEDIRDDGNLVSVGAGRYHVFMNGGALVDLEGNPYELRLTADDVEDLKERANAPIATGATKSRKERRGR